LLMFLSSCWIKVNVSFSFFTLNTFGGGGEEQKPNI
jgi:hypothetical protein